MSGQGGRGGTMAAIGGAGAAVIAGATYFFGGDGGDDTDPHLATAAWENLRIVDPYPEVLNASRSAWRSGGRWWWSHAEQVGS